MTKQFNIEFDGHKYFLVIDEENERCLARLDTRMDANAWLEIYKMLSEENEELRKEKIDVEVKLYSANEKILMQMDYDEVIKQNTKNEMEIISLKQENEELKKQLKSREDGFIFSCTKNYTEFDKDKLVVEDTHTKIRLDGKNLFIEVYIPQIDEFYRFKYTVTGKVLRRGFI